MLINIVQISEIGTTNQIPITFKNKGNINIIGTKNPKERINDINADIFPFAKAVNKAEENILNPSNKNETAKMRKPVTVILYNVEVLSVKIIVIKGAMISDIQNTEKQNTLII